jgi:hypothetical protein
VIGTVTIDDRSARARIALTALLLLLSAAALVATTARASAEELSDIPGAFVDVGLGAAEMGVAGAAVAGSHGATAIFWNPAGLAALERSKEFSLTHGEQMGLVSYSAACAATRVGRDLAVGVGIVHSGDDVLREMTGLVAAARPFGRIPWNDDRPFVLGAALRARWASYGNNESTDGQVTGTALGFGLDIGATAPVAPALSLGVVARDVVNTLTWDSSVGGSYGEAVPPALLAGVSADVGGSVRIEVDLDKALSADRGDIVAAGSEVRLFRIATVRAGYRRALSAGDFEEYAVGAGAVVPVGDAEATVDIAYLFGRLENTLRFSLGFGM